MAITYPDPFFEYWYSFIFSGLKNALKSIYYQKTTKIHKVKSNLTQFVLVEPQD